MDTNSTLLNPAPNAPPIANAHAMNRKSASPHALAPDINQDALRDVPARGMTLAARGTTPQPPETDASTTVDGDGVRRFAIPQRKNLILGIDPGLSGALAIYCIDSDRLLEVIDCPTNQIRGKRHVAIYEVAQFVKKYAPLVKFAVIEDVHSMPQQGVASTFAFGKSFGQIMGVVAANFIRILLVRPEVWKSSLNLSRDKNLSRLLASKVFSSHTKYFARSKDDGRAEASLMTHFAAKFMVEGKYGKTKK